MRGRRADIVHIYCACPCLHHHCLYYTLCTVHHHAAHHPSEPTIHSRTHKYFNAVSLSRPRGNGPSSEL